MAMQVFLLLNYSVAFYMIFRHISQNLLVLREQLNIIEDEESPMLHDVLQKKYKMFKYVASSQKMYVFINSVNRSILWVACSFLVWFCTIQEISRGNADCSCGRNSRMNITFSIEHAVSTSI